MQNQAEGTQPTPVCSQHCVWSRNGQCNSPPRTSVKDPNPLGLQTLISRRQSGEHTRITHRDESRLFIRFPQDSRKGSGENILAFWVRTRRRAKSSGPFFSSTKNKHLIRLEYHSMVGQDTPAFKQAPMMKMYPCPLRVNLGCSRGVKFRGCSSAAEHAAVFRVFLLLSSAQAECPAAFLLPPLWLCGKGCLPE